MKVTLVTNINPWFTSTASSNRLLSLAIGLSKHCEKVTLLIFGPYQSEKEKKIGLMLVATMAYSSNTYRPLY